MLIAYAVLEKNLKNVMGDKMKKVDINEALSFRHPEIVVLVVTKSKNGKINIAPIGWAMLGSSNPRTWAIGIAKQHYTHKAIMDSKEFTICLPSFEQKKDVLFCGTHTGWKINKLPKTKFKLLPATKVSSPLIDKTLACFECKLIDQLQTFDHTIFLGEIVAAHVSDRNNGLINIGHSKLVKIKRGTCR